LLIAFSNTQASGPGLVKSGANYQIEFSNELLAIEDMLTPVEGIYIGALTWKNIDGTDTGGSHWVMGLVQYRK